MPIKKRMLPVKWRHFRVHHKPLTYIQSLCLLSQSEIYLKVPAYFMLQPLINTCTFSVMLHHTLWADVTWKGNHCQGNWELRDTWKVFLRLTQSVKMSMQYQRECWCHNHPFEDGWQLPGKQSTDPPVSGQAVGASSTGQTCQWDCPTINTSTPK